MKTAYQLRSLCCNKVFEDKGWDLNCCDPSHPTGLIRTEYAVKQLNPGEESEGLYRFSDWLPVSKRLSGSAAPITYKSQGLAESLGLTNLYITFNGYWPEKGARMKTGTFKECEAYSVCARENQLQNKVMVVASAGNTARAFAKVCSENKIPLLLSVPEDNLEALWFEHPLDTCVKLVCCEKGGDYFDAIHISNIAIELDGFFPEGGAKNVARRDGMATTVLSAVTTIGNIPEYYFQAVGSGTGAIAAWEANLRFLEDGRYGSGKMKLMLSQNSPFLPMKEAWEAKSRAMLPMDDTIARKQVETINAKVLSNRKPPYPIPGGLYDAMNDAGGKFYGVTNDEAAIAAQLFLQSEGNDLEPAAAVAVASLIKSVNDGDVRKDSLIMLNITGGGIERFKKSTSLFYLEPSIVFPLSATPEEIRNKIAGLF